MGKETSQFNLSDRQLRANPVQSRDVLTDIGEAKVIHTIFGRAKVQIIRKQDQVRRMWMLIALAIAALAAAVWGGWLVLPTTGLLQTAAPARVQEVVAPVLQVEPTSSPAITHTMENKPAENKAGIPLTGLTPPAASQQNAPQPGLKAVAKPSGKQQMMPPASNNNVAKNPAVMQQPHKLSPPTPPVVPAAPPATVQPAAKMVAPPVQLAAPPNMPVSKPATVDLPAEPVTKKDTPALSSPGANPASGAVNEQP
ncbi:MAG: hypothetical protein HY016_10795 [Nitrosomonadales bacterium]|nr:hypothetical protein [Nitrosomonadales bacterium]